MLAYFRSWKMNLMAEMLPRVAAYLKKHDWNDIPVLQDRKFTVNPLAQGEYNLNYLISCGSLHLVFRVNIGTQINRDDQILYEYKALELLSQSGVTPRPYFVDDTRQVFERGILIMEYLPGESLDYRRDLPDAAGLFAVIHQMGVPQDKNHLIREDAPLTLIYEECAGLLRQYFDSDLAQPEIRDYLMDLKKWADAARSQGNILPAGPLALYRQHGSKLGQLHRQPAAGKYSSGRLGNAPLGRSVPRPLPLLLSHDNPMENRLENDGCGKMRVSENLQPAFAGSSSARYFGRPGKTARSFCLPARDFLVGHGLGGLSDPVFRYEKSGHLG